MEGAGGVLRLASATMLPRFKWLFNPLVAQGDASA